ncbi:MAG: GNAT family N-acetyltransferase [Actinomycetota bacterium]|jgi:mycothiol synthase|nr:GNAT family N-acetyltransferase [Actinomycetota bacterium]
MAELPQLFMRLPSLALTYPADDPSEQATPDDASGIAALLTETFEEPWDVERVRRELGSADGVDATYVVRDSGQIVAVASARHLPEQYPRAGYLHYVGAYGAKAGRGLGGLVTWAVLKHFRDEGLESAVLETDDFRLPAIRTYLKIGFVPEYRHEQDQSRWSKIIPLVLGRRQNPPARDDG